jgi:hypothetical protein
MRRVGSASEPAILGCIFLLSLPAAPELNVFTRTAWHERDLIAGERSVTQFGSMPLQGILSPWPFC